MKVGVSIIKSIHTKEKTLEKLLDTNLDYIHLDIMDGKFVPNKTFSKREVNELFKNYPVKLDIHLMVEKPKLYVKYLSNFNTEYITFHLEAFNKEKDVINMINLIKKYNVKVGISIKPNTKVEELNPYLDLVDQILVMSVEPGAGGQTFTDNAVPKIEYLSNYPNRRYIINVDGGINDKTIKKVNDADMVVSGSFVSMSDNYQKQINALK